MRPEISRRSDVGRVLPAMPARLNDHRMPAVLVVEPDQAARAGLMAGWRVEQVGAARQGAVVEFDQADTGVGMAGWSHRGSVAWRA